MKIGLMSKPLIIAHRGDMEYAPENTLPAFASAIGKGADGIEFDVHQARDGELIVHHFYGFGHTTDGNGLVVEKTLVDIKRLDAGSWFSLAFSGVQVPTLAEVFDLGKGKVHFEVDLKGSSLPFLQKVIGEIARFNLEGDVELTTAHYALLSHAKQINPRLRTGTFFLQPPEWMPLRLAQQHVLDWAILFDIQVAHLHLSLVTDDLVEQLHQRHIAVYGSNLDSDDEIRQGLDKRVDCFSTSHLTSALSLRDRVMKG